MKKVVNGKDSRFRTNSTNSMTDFLFHFFVICYLLENLRG